MLQMGTTVNKICIWIIKYYIEDEDKFINIIKK